MNSLINYGAQQNFRPKFFSHILLALPAKDRSVARMNFLDALNLVFDKKTLDRGQAFVGKI